MSHQQDIPPLSHLQLRAAQAPLAATLIRQYAQHVGLDRALEIAAAALALESEKAGKDMASKAGGNTLAHLARVVEEVWAGGGALDVRFREETRERLVFDVTRCGYAEIYADMDILDLGFCLSCSRDGAFARGFNPAIRLERTQTIMQGAPCCDFVFTLAPELFNG